MPPPASPRSPDVSTLTAPPRIGRRFARLAAVNALANLTAPLAGLVDAGLLGHLPEVRFFAGVALASLLFDYVYWTFGFLRMGTTGTTAQAVGAGERTEVAAALWRSALAGVLLGALLLLLRWPLREAGFALLSGAPEVEAAGRAYFDARLWGAPAALANLAFVGWFLGREESGRALALTVVASAANIALDWLFIVELGWAAAGAGWATALAQVLALGVALLLVAFHPERPAGRPERALLLDRRRLARIWKLHLDIAVRTLVLVSAFALFIDWSARLGTGTLAVNALLLKLVTFVAFLVDGAAYAVESLAGISLGLTGAVRRRALGRLLRLALGTGAAVSTAFLALLTLAPGWVYGLLTAHPEVAAGLHRFDAWLWPVLLVGSAAYVLDGFFLGLTAGKTLRTAMLLALGAGFLPLGAVALASGENHLLWAALALFMAARSGLLGRAARRRLEREGGTEPAPGPGLSEEKAGGTA